MKLFIYDIILNKHLFQVELINKSLGSSYVIEKNAIFMDLFFKQYASNNYIKPSMGFNIQVPFVNPPF